MGKNLSDATIALLAGPYLSTDYLYLFRSTASGAARDRKIDASTIVTLGDTQTLANKSLTSPTITGGAIDNAAIGNTTKAPGGFTTLAATGAVALSPANANVVLSPTGTGLVTIGPATAGALDNMVIGANTPKAGTFTALGATGAVTLSPANAAVTLSPTGTGVVTINPATAGTMDNVAIGGTTAAAMKGTTINATSAFQQGGTQVVGARRTGWGAASGTLSRSAYASYAGQTVSAGYVQAEAQATDNAVLLLSKTVAALITDLTAHGLIGP